MILLKWTYDPEASRWLDGFRIYQDCVLVYTVARDLRSVNISNLDPTDGEITVAAISGGCVSDDVPATVFTLDAPQNVVIDVTA